MMDDGYVCDGECLYYRMACALAIAVAFGVYKCAGPAIGASCNVAYDFCALHIRSNMTPVHDNTKGPRVRSLRPPSTHEIPTIGSK